MIDTESHDDGDKLSPVKRVQSQDDSKSSAK